MIMLPLEPERLQLCYSSRKLKLYMGTKQKKNRNDTGEEFVSRDFKNFCKNKGIELQ